MFLAFGNHIFQCFESFWVANVIPFSGKVRKGTENSLSATLGIAFKKLLKILKLSWGQKRTFWAFSNNTCFEVFEWGSWNRFIWKWGEASKTVQSKKES